MESNSGTKQGLIDKLRGLCIERTLWSRQKVISNLANLDDTQAASTKLTNVENSLGDALSPYFGGNIGSDVSGELKRHSALNADIVSAINAGDQQKADSKEKERLEHARKVAEYLSKSNSAWNEKELENRINEVCRPVHEQAQARKDKKYDKDTELTSQAIANSIKFADYICDGIIKKFPDRFK